MPDASWWPTPPRLGGHDISGFYRNASTIRDVNELGPALTQKLIGLLDA